MTKKKKKKERRSLRNVAQGHWKTLRHDSDEPRWEEERTRTERRRRELAYTEKHEDGEAEVFRDGPCHEFSSI